MASRYVEAGIPFLRSQNVKPGRIDMSSVAYIDEVFHSELEKSQLRAGDLVIVRTGEPGVTAVVPDGLGPLNCSDLVIARPLPGVNVRFLCYAINETARAYVLAHTVGAVQQHFNVASAKKLTVCLPSSGEQQAIVEVLGALDDKIAVNERTAATARELALALYAQSICNVGATEAAVASLATTLTRGVAPKYTELSEELAVLNQKCIRDGCVNLGPSRLTLREKVKPPKLLRIHDVLVNSTGVGTLGRVARWTLKQDATVDSHVTIVRFDEVKVDPVCAGFAMLRAQPMIEAMGEGSTGQTELRRSQIGELQIILPSPDGQKHLRPKLDALEERADHARSESRTLGALRDTLLPQLMSGKLRVRDAERIVEDAV
jgi:type I restriction enzyme S subunit